MARRRTPVPTGPTAPPAACKMGWCLDDDSEHDKCRVEYVDWNGNPRVCGCPNHKQGDRKPA